MITPKYSSLAKLVAAYASGELDRSSSPLVLDNDCAAVNDESGCVYREFPVALLREALDLLNIPWEEI